MTAVVAVFVVLCSVAAGTNDYFEAFRSDLTTLLNDKPLSATRSLIDAGLGSQILKVQRSPTQDPVSATQLAPVVQMHGLGDFANNPHGMVPLGDSISKYLNGAYVLNVQLGVSSAADIRNSFFMNLNDQVDYFAAVVGSDPKLKDGFNAIGYSQGSLVIRGYIQKYNNPAVLSFISLHGPLAGVSDGPACAVDDASDKDLCRRYSELLKTYANTPDVQSSFAPANYYRDPLFISEYSSENTFLKNLNNEFRNSDSTDFKKSAVNWASLRRLVLVKADKDSAIHPVGSEWLQFYENGARNYELDFRETPWYEGDTFGLQSLDKLDKIFFHATTGDHLELDIKTVLSFVKLHFT